MNNDTQKTLGALTYENTSREDHRAKSPSGATNLARAEHVARLLIRFTGDPLPGSEPASELIATVLADMMHLCRMNDLDFDAMLATAHRLHNGDQIKQSF